jgi:hypothetical protein
MASPRHPSASISPPLSQWKRIEFQRFSKTFLQPHRRRTAVSAGDPQSSDCRTNRRGWTSGFCGVAASHARAVTGNRTSPRDGPVRGQTSLEPNDLSPSHGRSLP